jgi:hypothetical protein
VRGAEAVEEVQERHRDSSVAAWAIRPKSMPPARARASMAKPVWRQAITSEWSPKIDSAWVASERAET